MSENSRVVLQCFVSHAPMIATSVSQTENASAVANKKILDNWTERLLGAYP